MARSVPPIPTAVRRRALAHGEVGARWLRELPSVVAELERRLDVTVDDTLAGGTAAYVASATTSDGTPVVVKIAMPAEIDGVGAFDQAVQTLQLANGRGCVTLLAYDAELRALLLERLGRNLDALGLPVHRQLEIICRTLQQVWVSVPSDARLPIGADKALWLANYVGDAWESLDRPCSAAAIERALDFAARRAAAFDPASAVLVHGDAHSWNTLEAERGRFKLVDPEGLASEPAHDLAVPMRELNEELLGGDALLLGRQRARFLSKLTGVDATAIWQWGFVERVSTGLYALSLGHDGARGFLDVADRWAQTD
jgi:streptomycin 6-kinase